jgi:N-acetylneuraminate synthase
MHHTVKIGERIVGDGYPVFLIAEAGVNHNGDLETAKKLIDIAIEVGADAVKFQTYKTENLILENVDKAQYQRSTTGKDGSQADMLRSLEIDRAFHKALIEHCEDRNIIFLSTPYGAESLALLIDLNVPAIKIASTDTTNLKFLAQVGECAKPVILSTGMSSLSEIEKAFSCLKENGCTEIAILKCTSNYPTKPENVNLRGLTTLKNCFDTVIGFSDHTQGVGASPFAAAMGAKIIEKHFTLDKSMEGPDHKASLSPDQLDRWVKEIRKVELMLGKKELMPTKSEKEIKRVLQKCLVSQVKLKKGVPISKENIDAKRTGGVGIPAIDFENVIGLKPVSDINENKPIFWWDLCR